MADSPASSSNAGLSLYADLLDPGKKADSGTITGAPVKYNLKPQEVPEVVQKKKDASLQFQPIRRLQNQNKAKVKKPGSVKFPTNVAPSGMTSSSSAQSVAPTQRSKFEDWVGHEDEEITYQRPKYQNKKRKTAHNKAPTRTWDWNDIYDPAFPNRYADYRGSEEQFRETQDWKRRLYHHHIKVIEKEKDEPVEQARNPMFAPPSNLTFAPPSVYDDVTTQDVHIDAVENQSVPQSDGSQELDERPSFSAPSLVDDKSGEDAYARRARLSGLSAPPVQEVLEPAKELSAGESDMSTPMDADKETRKADAMAKVALMKAKIEASRKQALEAASVPPPPPPPPPETIPPSVEQESSTISRAPVRYTQPAVLQSEELNSVSTELEPNKNDESAENAAAEKKSGSSNRKGFSGLGEKLLRKYGWEQGQGLGAQGEGIVQALSVKADKRKKKSDADGGGWAAPKNMGKIVSYKKRRQDDDKDDEMSEVIKIEGMLNDLDVTHEVQENGLMQRIGDDFKQKYGNIERLYVWSEDAGGNNEVFIKFTSQLSALRAINATDKGENVVISFYNVQKFENGEYS